MKCRQVIATMTDNRKWQCGHQNRKCLYLWNYDRYDDNSNGKSRVFDHALREETDTGRLRQRPTTENSNVDVLGSNLAILANLLLGSSLSKIPNLSLEFRRYLSDFQRCNYFRFWEPYRYFRLSVAVVLTCQHCFPPVHGLIPRFVTGILTVPFIVSET